MKRTICILTILIVAGSINLYGQGVSPDRGLLGIGVVAGEPTGLSAKYWTQPNRAIDFALGASYYSDFRFHTTYLFHTAHDRFPVHYGVGFSMMGQGQGPIVIGNDDERTNLGFGPRGALGLSYLMPTAPLDIFFEVGATMLVIDPVGMELDLLLGTRFYF